jgi:hypothetical protein
MIKHAHTLYSLQETYMFLKINLIRTNGEKCRELL